MRQSSIQASINLNTLTESVIPRPNLGDSGSSGREEERERLETTTNPLEWISLNRKKRDSTLSVSDAVD